VTRFLINVHIVPRKGLLGKAVADSLRTLGFSGVRDVHVGRHLVLELEAADAAAADRAVRDMCGRLLANPVTEDFEIAAVRPA
jgi:phosphoribosylformylglycinamidine synthase